MSERGSFVTDYIYCNKCFEAAKRVLLGNDKYLRGIVVPGWSGLSEELPIIAGKVGGLYSGEEFVTFEEEIIPELEKRICHTMRIAVLAETGQRVFFLRPSIADRTSRGSCG